MILKLIPPTPETNPGANDRRAWIESTVNHLEARAIIGTPGDCRRRLAEVQEEWGIEHMPLYLHVLAGPYRHVITPKTSAISENLLEKNGQKNFPF